jgi:glycosyltransferase involved in cell wall biosynthesis
MRIAVVDHVGNHGGGSRVVRLLLPALKRRDPSLHLSYFGNPASIQRESLREDFRSSGIEVQALTALKLSHGPLVRSDYARKAVTLVQSRWLQSRPWLPLALSGDVARELSRRLKGFDLAFFPWPYMLPRPALDCPAVGLFHDFNFKYYFGGPFVFSPAQRAQIEREMPVWLDSAVPVVSTHFMASELRAFYPQAASRVRVIHLAALGGVDRIDDATAARTVAELGVVWPYVLYATHMASHKNAGPLIAAISLLRDQGRAIRLVLTGAGTEAIRGRASAIGVRLGLDDPDVIGMGYVSNTQVDSLVQCATAVVSPSLYEAGNGPGLDGWGKGTPVAMARIPAFLEHLEVQGVRAQVFDPRDPREIARSIAAILDNPEEARADAAQSRRALQSFSWDETADAYLDVFRSAVSTAGVRR